LPLYHLKTSIFGNIHPTADGFPVAFPVLNFNQAYPATRIIYEESLFLIFGDEFNAFL